MNPKIDVHNVFLKCLTFACNLCQIKLLLLSDSGCCDLIVCAHSVDGHAKASAVPSQYSHDVFGNLASGLMLFKDYRQTNCLTPCTLERKSRPSKEVIS